jgi:hypothetical protein
MNIEIGALVKTPFELGILNTVLSILHHIYLRIA